MNSLRAVIASFKPLAFLYNTCPIFSLRFLDGCWRHAGQNFSIWPAAHLPNRPLPCLTADSVRGSPDMYHQLTYCITNMLVWPNYFNDACSCPVRCSPNNRQAPSGPRTETAWVHPRNWCAVTAVQSSLYPAYTQGAFLEGAAGAALAVQPRWAKCRPECRSLSGSSWGRRAASQNHVGFGVSAAGDIQHWHAAQ